MDEKQSSLTGIISTTETKLHQIQEMGSKPISKSAQVVGFGILAVSTVVVASILAFHIITGVLALVVTGAAAVGLWAGWSYVKKMNPVYQLKLRNHVMNKMMNEAREQAIAQLNNEVKSRHARLVASRDARDKMGAMISNMKEKLSQARPDSDVAKKMQGILSRVEPAYEIVKTNLDKAATANKQFEIKVQDYKDLKEYADMAGEAMAMFDSSESTKLQEMLSLESFRSIDADFTTAIVSIENSARDMAIDQSN